MKKSKTKNSCKVDPSEAGPGDWTPLFAAFRDAFEWALDVACHLARDFPEEVESVERVRTFMRKRIAGETAHIRIDDVMFTFGLLIGAIQRDLAPVSNLGPWFATSMRLPSAGELLRQRPYLWSLSIEPLAA